MAGEEGEGEGEGAGGREVRGRGGKGVTALARNARGRVGRPPQPSLAVCKCARSAAVARSALRPDPPIKPRESVGGKRTCLPPG